MYVDYATLRLMLIFKAMLLLLRTWYVALCSLTMCKISPYYVDPKIPKIHLYSRFMPPCVWCAFQAGLLHDSSLQPDDVWAHVPKKTWRRLRKRTKRVPNPDSSERKSREVIRLCPEFTESYVKRMDLLLSNIPHFLSLVSCDKRWEEKFGVDSLTMGVNV